MLRCFLQARAISLSELHYCSLYAGHPEPLTGNSSVVSRKVPLAMIESVHAQWDLHFVHFQRGHLTREPEVLCFIVPTYAVHFYAPTCAASRSVILLKLYPDRRGLTDSHFAGDRLADDISLDPGSRRKFLPGMFDMIQYLFNKIVYGTFASS